MFQDTVVVSAPDDKWWAQELDKGDISVKTLHKRKIVVFPITSLEVSEQQKMCPTLFQFYLSLFCYAN